MAVVSVTITPASPVTMYRGEPFTATLTAELDTQGPASWSDEGILPLGVNIAGQTITGTPTALESGTAQIRAMDEFDLGLSPKNPWQWTVIDRPTLETPEGLAGTPGQTTVALTWTPEPAATGYVVAHRVEGDPEWVTTPTPDDTAALTLEQLTPATVYEVTVAATDGTTTTPASSPVTVQTLPADPGPDPDPDEEPAELTALVDALAPKLAAYLGRPDDAATIATARAQLPVVVEFIHGYTRGRKWTGYTPPYPLRAVIVSAGARLVTNPEQVSQYAAADYTERPAVLSGYTLAELGVLHRYRRVSA